MRNKIKKEEKGITLIALVITIIVLLILAGVAISMLSGENGILKQAVKAKEANERAQALEAAQSAYMSSQMVNQGEEENKIVSDAIDDLKEQDYIIYTHSLDAETIKSIKYMLNDGEIQETTIQKGDSKEIVLSTEIETTNNVEYYIQVNNKYYLLTMNSKEVTIGDTEVDISNLENNSGESITEVISNNTAVVTATLNDAKTNITIRGESAGETTIITKTNLGQIASLKVTVTNNATGITISSTEGNSINVGNSTTLTATLSPIDASDSSITWSVGDSSIAQLSSTSTEVTNGTASVIVTGNSAGKTTITARSSSGVTQTYDLTVIDMSSNIDMSKFYLQQINETDQYGQYTNFKINGSVGGYDIYYWYKASGVSDITSKEELISESKKYNDDVLSNCGRDMNTHVFLYLSKNSGKTIDSPILRFDPSNICFEKDTLVSTIKGLKKIQDINIGEYVYSYNEKKDTVEKKEVRNVFKNKIQAKMCKISVNNEKIISTTNHPFYLNGKWIKACGLKKNDILKNQFGKNLTIDEVSMSSDSEENVVYNLEIADNHNYFVGKSRVLVHNAPSHFTCSYAGTIVYGEVFEF